MSLESLASLIDINAWSVPGCQCVVRQDGKSIFEQAQGVADVVKQESMTMDHWVPMGSLLHSVLAAMIIQLMQVSTLPFGATLQQIAKQYHQDGGRLASIVASYSRLRSLTLLDLLQHTSGLPSYNQTEVFLSALMRNPKKNWQLEAYLDMVTGPDVAYCYGYQPASKGCYSYSATNLLLASLVVSAITGHDLLDELDLFASRHFPGNAAFTSVQDKDFIDSLQLARGYVLPSSPYRSLFERLPLVSYADSSECVAYDVSTAHYLHNVAGLVGFASLRDLASWMDTVWIDNSLGSAERVLFPSLVLAPELTADGNPVYSGLGCMQTVTEKFGRLYWLNNYTDGHEIMVIHAQDHATTVALMFNMTREIVELQKGSLMYRVLGEVLS